MKKSKHIMARMSQRGIPKRLLDCAMEFGDLRKNKVVLNKKSAQMMILELEKIKKNLMKISDKGGVTIVLDNDILITTYSNGY